MKTSLKGIGMTSGAGIIFGAFPIFTTLFVRFGGDVDTFNLYGFVLTVVFLAFFMLATKRSFRLPKQAVLFVILAGLMNVITRILLTYSYEYLDVLSSCGSRTLVAQQHVESSRTRDRTHVPCTGSQILNHWTTRESLF